MMTCARCDSFGQIVAVEKETKKMFCFLCTCEISQKRNLSKLIPVWNDSFRHRFDVDFDNYQPIKSIPKRSNEL